MFSLKTMYLMRPIGSVYFENTYNICQVYAIGFPTTKGRSDFASNEPDAQERVVKLLDLVNNLSYRLHKYTKWSTADLDQLETDLKLVLELWEKLNDVAEELGKPRDVVKLASQKIGCLNTIRATIHNFGALRFLSSAVGEKAHQMPKHCLEISKGVNKERNALKQALRLEYSDLRGVYAGMEKLALDDSEAQDAGDAAAAPTGVALVGQRSFDDAFPDVEDDVVARVCHLIRTVVQTKAVELGGEALHDYTALLQRIPAQQPTAAGKLYI